MMTAEKKTKIARIVRGVNIDTPGALCWFRTAIGLRILAALGIKAIPVCGGLVYRAGPDETRDVVAFCGFGNYGIVEPDRFLAHTWIMTKDLDFIDFTLGDWPEQIKHVSGVEDRYADGTSPGDIVWTAPPLPPFIWGPSKKLYKKNPIGTPKLGQLWYTPARVASNEAYLEAIKKGLTQYKEIVDQAFPLIKPYLERL